jgi:hypothetical protein
MIPYIIAAGLGYLLNDVLRSEKSDKNKNKTKSENKFFVFVRSKDFGKSNLVFGDFASAKKLYDKVVSSKKIKYKDIVDADNFERSLYEGYKSEGNIGKEGYPSGLNAESKVEEIVIGQGENDFERKEF